MTKNIDKKLKELYSAVDLLFIQECFTFWNRIKKVTSYSQSQKRLIFTTLAIGAVVIIIAIGYGTTSFSKATTNTTITRENIPTQTGQQREITEGEKAASLQILDGFKESITFFSPVFDSFIGSTPDPTGKVETNGSNYSYNPNGNSQLTFSVSGQAIRAGFNASEYSNGLLSFATVILTVLIVFRAITFITDDEENKTSIKSFVYRIIYTIILLIVTPHILGISIFLNNVLVQRLTQDQSLTSFIANYLDILKLQINDSPTATGWNLDAFINPAGNALQGIVSALPLLVSLLLILLLFLYLSFQFVIRFINLFFLAVIYPLVVIFYISPKTSGIPATYWKIWVAFLIHQPAFVLGYIIVQKMLGEALLSSGAQPQLIILFLGMLLFLTTINILTARIWGDVYTAVSTNIQAGIGAGMATKAFSFAARQPRNLVKGSALLSGFGGRKGNSVKDEKGVASGQFGNIKGNQQLPKGKTGLKVNHNKLWNPEKSAIGQQYSSKGFEVKSVDSNKGVLGITGDFYQHENPITGIKTLYTSKEEALSDKIEESELTRTKQTVNVIDTSNRQARQSYNMDLSQEAKKAGTPTKEVHLTQSPSDDRIQKSMNMMKEKNRKNGVQGVAVTRYPNGSDKNSGAKQIHKIHIYNDNNDS